MSEIPTFNPTMEEFVDFASYIAQLEDQGVHNIGLCKVIPPPEWVARLGSDYSDIGDCVVDKPVCQITHGGRGIYYQEIMTKKSMSFADFSKLAQSDVHSTPPFRDFDHLEKKYWATINVGRPLYGANVSGSLFTCESTWNLNTLDTILSQVLDDEQISLPGVTTPYLYFGMWRSTFPWHVEDANLYSINYLHYGAPKFWYVIPLPYARKFEAFVMAQHQNEFMVNFPYAYHAGFNTGLNVAEATNFALKRWIDFGKKAGHCNCWDDTVRIDMMPFIARYQPENYEAWRSGIDDSPHPLVAYQLASTKSCPSETGSSISGDSVKVGSAAAGRPDMGDINAIDMRYIARELCEAKLPYHLKDKHRLLPLWCGYEADARVEREVNRAVGSREPHCAICCLLWHPYRLIDGLRSTLSGAYSASSSSKCCDSLTVTPLYTIPLIPDVAFQVAATGSTNSHVTAKSSSPTSDASSLVLHCSRCCLTVHSKCYGLTPLATNLVQSVEARRRWLCDACLAPYRPVGFCGDPYT